VRRRTTSSTPFSSAKRSQRAPAPRLDHLDVRPHVADDLDERRPHRVEEAQPEHRNRQAPARPRPAPQPAHEARLSSKKKIPSTDMTASNGAP
jgi:hypothetical protein